MRFARAVGVAALSTTIAACGSFVPSAKPATNPVADPDGVLHIENRVSQALAFQADVLAGGGTGVGWRYFTPLRPCSDTAFTFGEQIPLLRNIEDWRSTVFVDPTARLDRALDDWQGDPHEMPGNFSHLTAVVWTSREVELASLPRWLTVGPEGGEVGDRATPIPDACPALDEFFLHPPG